MNLNCEGEISKVAFNSVKNHISSEIFAESAIFLLVNSKEINFDNFVLIVKSCGIIGFVEQSRGHILRFLIIFYCCTGLTDVLRFTRNR